MFVLNCRLGPFIEMEIKYAVTDAVLAWDEAVSLYRYMCELANILFSRQYKDDNLSVKQVNAASFVQKHFALCGTDKSFLAQANGVDQSTST